HLGRTHYSPWLTRRMAVSQPAAHRAAAPAPDALPAAAGADDVGTSGIGMTSRDLVETTVRERARHDTSDKVGDTRSFANMEQALTREYWGRFLIELLQNARDAWLSGVASHRDGLLRIRLTEDPALVVCNEG